MRCSVFSVLNNFGGNLMQGVNLVPLRIDLAPLLFELGKGFVGHDDDVVSSVGWIRFK
jgi:hypothetical protein